MQVIAAVAYYTALPSNALFVKYFRIRDFLSSQVEREEKRIRNPVKQLRCGFLLKYLITVAKSTISDL